MKFLMKPFLMLLALFVTTNLRCQIASEQKSNKALIWKEIAPFFSVPDEYTGQFGDYPSPLKFYDGHMIKDKKDWQERREEILTRWHEMMGQWPELITNQQMEYLDTIKKENFIQYKVRFQWLPRVQTIGYLLVPEGEHKKPAVISVYYEPETAIGIGPPYRDFAYQLAKRGFVTLSIGEFESDYPDYYPNIENVQWQMQPLSMLAYAAANAWNVLAEVDEVDSKRIGIVGHSYGGKWALFASCLYEKFACAVWSDPGIVFDESKPNVNYWEPWYLGYHPGPFREPGIITEDNPAGGLYPELVKNGFDLTDLHALMAPRPFLVSGGAEDPPKRWVALNHSIAVNKLLGYNHRVAMTNRKEHSPNEDSNEQIFQFFEYFLK